MRLDVPGARGSERVVRTRERQAMDHHKLQRSTRYVDSLPQRQRPEQARAGVSVNVPHELAGVVFSLTKQRVRQPFTHRLAGRLRTTHRREQPQRPTTGGLDQFSELIEHLGGGAVAPRWRQMRGDVKDRLLLVLERRANVEAPPWRRAFAGEPDAARDRLEATAQLERRRRHDDALLI